MLQPTLLSCQTTTAIFSTYTLLITVIAKNTLSAFPSVKEGYYFAAQ